MTTKTGNTISTIGLDPDTPYSLGNKIYYYERECNSGHNELTDQEIAYTGGYYDGYNWTVPVCMRCIGQLEDKRPMVYAHSKQYHLKKLIYESSIYE